MAVAKPQGSPASEPGERSDEAKYEHWPRLRAVVSAQALFTFLLLQRAIILAEPFTREGSIDLGVSWGRLL